MTKVNVYMETDPGSRKRMYRGYGAVVEFIRRDGKPETRMVSGLCDGTWNMAFILALTDALGILTRPCAVIVHAPDRYVCESIRSGRVHGWARNGWRTIKGEPVANAEEWRALLKESEQHEIYYVHGTGSPYSDEIQEEIKEIKSRGEKWEQMHFMA